MPIRPAVGKGENRIVEKPEYMLSSLEQVPPQEAFEPVLTGHLMVIHRTKEPVRVFERSDGYSGEGMAWPGHINLFSAGDMSLCRWDRELDFFRLDLSPDLVQKVAGELELPGGARQIDFATQIRLQDERIVQLVRWLHEEQQSGGMGGRLYSDSLMRMLTVHMLDRYGSGTRAGSRTAPHKLDKNQLDQALQYIDAFLDQDISLEDLAGAAHISSSHLVRLFKQTTGLPPHQYIIRERIRRSQQLLLSGLPVHEVAAVLNFSDQSHFHRHFKRVLGVTPRQFVLGSR